MPRPAGGSDALFDQALRLRLRQPARLLGIGQQLQALAGGDALALGQALLVQAWHGMAMQGAAAAQAQVQQALAVLDQAGPPGLAWAEDLRSLQAHWSGQFGPAIDHAEAALAAGPHALLAPVLMARLGSAHANQGRLDEALPWFYRARASAAGVGEPGILAGIVSIVGGVQFSLGNLDDGVALAEQAWQLVCDAEPDQTWAVAAINQLVSLANQQQHALWPPLAQAFEAASAAFNPQLRLRGMLAIAGVMADAGQLASAQRVLDDVRAQWPAAAALPVDAVWVQALLLNQAGQAQQALALCRERLAPGSASLKADAPLQQAKLYAQAVAAARALGDTAQALHWQIELTQLQQRIHQDAARSRRITLQIQFELQAAQQAREAAQRGEQQALLEGQRLAELNQRLHEASLAKTRFLAAASHDLRQPIHAMALQMAELRAQALPGAASASVARLGRVLDGLVTMFDALLDISRMDAGAVRPQPQAMVLRPLLLRLVDEFTPQAQAAGLQLRLWAPRRGATHSDPVLLESLLRNLLSNAIKYTPRGGVLLALRPGLAAAEDGAPQRPGQPTLAGPTAWRLQVIDTGVGLSAEEQAEVFEEFHRTDGARASGAPGLGLGLSIVRRVSSLLGHPVRLRSRPGRGSAFSLCLPVRHEPPLELQAHGAPAAPGLPVEPVPGGQRALNLALLDDDAEQRQTLAALLRRWGHQVRDAADADGWVGQTDWLQGLDAVLLDMHLAGERSGPQELARLCRAAERPLPALLLTGETRPGLLAESGLPWLPKPLQPGRLRQWLRQLPGRTG